ncbi:MAG: CotH kinase family protein, partial [Oligoflexia bacterium]|nr:CotH kinase family protein [Oligoflexia bacterium]
NISDKMLPKKQYQIDFVDKNGKDEDYSFLGMPAASSWVITGSFADRSVIRNALVHNLGRDMGKQRNNPSFAQRNKFTEVFINKQYMGLYLAIEKPEIHENRLDIPTMSIKKFELSHEISYLAQVQTDIKEVNNLTDMGTNIKFRYPSDKKIEKWRKENSEVATKMMNAIMSDIQRFENALWDFSQNPQNTRYQDLVDIDSLVDYVVVQEATKNIDGYRRSLHFYKGKNGKIYFGPLWDFDLAIGNVFLPSYDSHRISGWNFPRKHYLDLQNPPFWFRTLMTDPLVVSKFIIRYKELRSNGGILSDNEINTRIDLMIADLGNSTERNYATWGRGRNPIVRYIYDRPPYLKGFEANFEKMREWLLARLKWMDQNVDDLQKFPDSRSRKEKKKEKKVPGDFGK